MKSPTLSLLAALFAATPVRGAVNEDSTTTTTTNMESPCNNSKILSTHDTMMFVQGLEALRSGKSPRRDDYPFRQLRKDSKSAKMSKSAKNTACLCGNSESSTHKQELDQCMHDLEEAKKPVQSFLFVQMADVCVFELGEDGSVSFYSNSFLEDTEQFSNKPFRLESTVPTHEFFGKFDSTYFPAGDKPNSAITLVDEEESEGLVVSVFASAFNSTDEEGNTVYGYKLTQSKEQEGVKSLNDIMDGKGVKEYAHCSVFIDASQLFDRRI